jgi:hypothetical protein
VQLRLVSRFLVAALLAGCAAPTAYEPHVLARGEVTLRYRGRHFEAWAGGHEIARGLGWRGLKDYVACVPAARDNAIEAVRAGDLAVGLSAAGGTLGVLGLGGLAGLADEAHRWIWVGVGAGVAVAGVVLAAVGRLERNRANGRAVDAVNFYDDAVGSLGGTCADLAYPPPAPAPAR